jgi:hypothetical protein
MGALLVWTIARGELNLDAVSAFFLMGILSVCALLLLNSTLQLDEERNHLSVGWEEGQF